MAEKALQEDFKKTLNKVNSHNRALKEKRKEQLHEDMDYAARSFQRTHGKGRISVTIPRVPWHEDD